MGSPAKDRQRDTVTSELQGFQLLSPGRFSKLLGHLSTLKGRKDLSGPCCIWFLSSCWKQIYSCSDAG